MTFGSFRPEEELLLHCAGTRLSKERAEAVTALLAKNLEWGYVIRMARQHGVLPFLHNNNNLTAVGNGQVPKQVREELTSLMDRQAKRSLLMAVELGRVLGGMEKDGIPVIPVKGPVLAQELYGNVAMRPCADLDLLVKRTDVSRACAWLETQGYQTKNSLPKHLEPSFLKNGCQWVFVHEEQGIPLELHWAWTPRYYASGIREVEWWERLETTNFLGRTIRKLCREDELLALCIHGAKHGWERLEWICDVTALVNREQDLDWDQVKRRAEEAGVRRELVLGLLVTERLGDQGLPHECRQWTHSDPQATMLCDLVYHRLFRNGPNAWSLPEKMWFHLRSKDRWQDRGRYLWRLTATPNTNDWTWLPLPPGLAWFHYLLRPVRLAVKYGGRWLRRLIGTDQGRHGGRGAHAEAAGKGLKASQRWRMPA